MKKTKKTIFYWLLFSALFLLIILIMQPLEIFFLIDKIPLLFPDGIIGIEQRDLLLLIQVLMLLFVIPVYIFTFIFSWWYRAENDKSKYDPHLIDNTLAEVVWWGLPLVMTIIVSVITWIETHRLDPYKPLESTEKSVKIEVVALQWNWIFFYPEENIATMNYLKIPAGTPVHFLITADAPMNTLWIPRLGGMIYAMPGMRTELHLIADKTGEFRGSSAMVSGEGFADMTFKTEAVTREEFQDWIASVKNSPEELTWDHYQKLARPTLKHPIESYRLKEDDLFHRILMKYMTPPSEMKKTG